jgi:hypothetical protein
MKLADSQSPSLDRSTGTLDCLNIADSRNPRRHFSVEERSAAIKFILAAVCEGRSVRSVLLKEANLTDTPRLPGIPMWWRWVSVDATLSEHLARAREFGIEALLDQCIDIADNPAEDPASRRVRIETRMKLAQMLKPRKYGPKLDVTSNQQTVGLAEAIAAARLRVVEGKASFEADRRDG